MDHRRDGQMNTFTKYSFHSSFLCLSDFYADIHYHFCAFRLDETDFVTLLLFCSYVAPEYAMTGHLLVKSDVYSYGVVLLELLTGRKPVDLSQPPGQENLVAWARPLLTSKEGLQKIIDPIIKPVFSVDTMVKVAAIASMCVQPEVTQRPFMGEVVQALKLVCSEFEETSYVRLKSFREDDLATSVPGERVGISECNITLPQPG